MEEVVTLKFSGGSGKLKFQKEEVVTKFLGGSGKQIFQEEVLH